MAEQSKADFLAHHSHLDPVIEAEYVFKLSCKDICRDTHSHNYYKLFLVVDGSVIHKVKGSATTLSRGSLVFIRPRDYHCFERDGSNGCRLISLAFLPKAMEALRNYLGKGFDTQQLLSAELPPMVFLTNTETAYLNKRMKQLNAVPLDDKYLLKMEIRIRLVELLWWYFSKHERKPKKMPQWLEELCNKMQKPENFASGTDAMLELSCKSKEHLCRTFKRYLGKTQTQYVNELRLNYSANQLMRTSKKITEIALGVGFGNLSHFYHLFKKHYNLTPAKFREKYST